MNEIGTPLLTKSAFHRSKRRLAESTNSIDKRTTQKKLYQSNLSLANNTTLHGYSNISEIPMRRTSSHSKLETRPIGLASIPKPRCSSSHNLMRQNAFELNGDYQITSRSDFNNYCLTVLGEPIRVAEVKNDFQKFLKIVRPCLRYLTEQYVRDYSGSFKLVCFCS